MESAAARAALMLNDFGTILDTRMADLFIF
jgi:hypothetical protein